MTREELIALIDRATVPQTEWRDRDSARAQMQLGEGRALLLAGCDYVFTTDPAQSEDTIWIEITYRGFNAFELGCPDWNGPFADECTCETDLCYIPTAKRLDKAKGGDWY